MDLTRKLELMARSVASIAEHDDAPQAEVSAALDAVETLVKTHRDGMIARREAKARDRAAAAEALTLTAADVGSIEGVSKH